MTAQPLAAPTRARPDQPRRHPWLAAVGYGLTLGVLLITLAIACVTIVVPRFAGAVPLTVLSNSMAPSMPVGSLAVVKPTMDLAPGMNINTLSAEHIRYINSVDRLVPGNVIAFQPHAADSTLIMHRITRVTVRADGSRTFTTQGDNNASADDPVQDYMVRGQMWYHLPYLGYANNFLNADGGRHTVAIITIAAVGYSWAALLVYRAAKRRNVPEASTRTR